MRMIDPRKLERGSRNTDCVRFPTLGASRRPASWKVARFRARKASRNAKDRRATARKSLSLGHSREIGRVSWIGAASKTAELYFVVLSIRVLRSERILPIYRRCSRSRSSEHCLGGWKKMKRNPQMRGRHRRGMDRGLSTRFP